MLGEQRIAVVGRMLIWGLTWGRVRETTFMIRYTVGLLAFGFLALLFLVLADQAQR